MSRDILVSFGTLAHVPKLDEISSQLTLCHSSADLETTSIGSFCNSSSCRASKFCRTSLFSSGRYSITIRYADHFVSALSGESTSVVGNRVHICVLHDDEPRTACISNGRVRGSVNSFIRRSHALRVLLTTLNYHDFVLRAMAL